MQRLGRFPQFLTLHVVWVWWALASSALLSAVLPVSGWAQGPAGSEFQLNTYTTSHQAYPGVAADANGNFVVVWLSYGQDGSFNGVFGQRFSAAGAVQGSEFRVNSYTTNVQSFPGVASDANGNFVVVSIGARLRLDDGTRANTGFFNITDGPHSIEFDWIRASAPGANDGIFTLRIDDIIDSTITTLNNDVSSIDFARLGALSIKTGAAGTLFFDQFESRRQRFIGPE